MKRIYCLSTAILLLISFTGTMAQEKWSLQKCIDHALKNNIQIKEQTLNSNYYNNLLSQAKSNRLPTLNSYVENSMSFGRTLASDNTYINVNSNATSGNLSTSFTLWKGNTLNNAIKNADFNLKSTLEDLEKAKNDLMMNIAADYLEILLANELVSVAQDLLKITQLQIERTGKLVDAGSLAKGSLLEIEAQYAREELNVIKAQNRLQLAYLALYQLLDLPATENFLVEKPMFAEINANMSLMNTTDVFKNAVDLRPEVKSAGYKLESARKQLLISKGDMLPSLVFSGSYYNYYNNKYTDYNGDKVALSSQLNTNATYGFGLTLNIPIFNQFQVRNGIANSKIQVEKTELDLQNTKNVLRKEIEQAYTDALAAFKTYLANQKTLTSSQEAFRYTEQKFEVGMINSVEYNQSKNNLSSAQSDLLQAKYEFIFKTKILDFYNGRPIEL
jgi:outer membrane protein